MLPTNTNFILINYFRAKGGQRISLDSNAMFVSSRFPPKMQKTSRCSSPSSLFAFTVLARRLRPHCVAINARRRNQKPTNKIILQCFAELFSFIKHSNIQSKSSHRNKQKISKRYKRSMENSSHPSSLLYTLHQFFNLLFIYFQTCLVSSLVQLIWWGCSDCSATRRQWRITCCDRSVRKLHHKIWKT